MKQEWPRNWPTFITDIVGASKTSESLCTNNMTIFKLLRCASYTALSLYMFSSFPLCFHYRSPTHHSHLLAHSLSVSLLLSLALFSLSSLTHVHTPSCSEEVFDFSSGQMTQVKAKHLKDSMCNEFSQIFNLCSFVLVSQ